MSIASKETCRIAPVSICKHARLSTHEEHPAHTHTHTCSELSLRIRLWSASYVQKHQQLDDMMNIHIITVDVDHIKQQRSNICSPSCDLYAPRGGTLFIYLLIYLFIYIYSRYVFTGTHPLGPRWPPAGIRSFTSIQMAHTHQKKMHPPRKSHSMESGN